jgi:enediyne biosynthesis protein E4
MYEMMRIAFIIFLLFRSSLMIGQQSYFTEFSDSAGLTYIYPGNEFQMAGGGLMIIDVNNDGWEDLFQSGGVFESKLWMNEKGKFVDRTVELGLDKIRKYYVQGALCADYDNDGFQDFVVTNYGIGMGRGDKQSPVILRNIGGVSFEVIDLKDVLPPGNYSSGSWGDVNLDGFPDLYLTNYVASMGALLDSNGNEIGYDPRCFENKLLLNLGGKGFREVSELYGVADGGCGLAASFTDYDLDGDVDLLLLNDFGEWTKKGNRCYRNNYPESSFTDVSEQMGFNSEMYGMGIGQGDHDRDGDPDYYITNIGQNHLYENHLGSFKEKAVEYGVDLTFAYDSVMGTSWSGLFFDADFDGDQDLYVSRGNVLTLVPKTVIKDKNRFFLSENGRFVDHSGPSGVNDILSHRGAVITDFDHDGDLDIISAVVKLPWAAFAQTEQKIKLYRNELPQGKRIGVLLKGDGENINTDCFGCHVVVHQEGKKSFREVDGGSGQASQSGRVIWIGLGEKDELEGLEVHFTKGSMIWLERLAAGQLYIIHPDGTVEQDELSE